jgi:hypothetical protein
MSEPHADALRRLMEQAGKARDSEGYHWFATDAHEGLRHLELLQEEHRKVLVRARNEGLEKAAVKASNVGYVALAVVIRAMKEPE